MIAPEKSAILLTLRAHLCRLTTLAVDAIVNAANSSLLSSGDFAGLSMA